MLGYIELAQGGVAILSRWTSRMGNTERSVVPVGGVTGSMNKLPLATAWICGLRDAVSDEMLAALREDLESHTDQA